MGCGCGHRVWHIGRYAAIGGVEGLELTGGKCETL
jgi:hypothetical protein